MKYSPLSKNDADIEGLGALFSEYIPNYRNLITSYLAKK